jgi:hypothetical protein
MYTGLGLRDDEMVVRNMLSLDCYSASNAFSMRLWRLAHVWTAYRSEFIS